MERKECIWALNPKKKYLPCPLDYRFASDNVGMDMDNRDYSLNDKGLGYCFIKGAAGKDLSKRMATIHLTCRVVGEQIVKPFLILRNQNPSEDRKYQPQDCRDQD